MHASTKWIVREIALLVALLFVLGAFGFPLVLPYGWHKTLHIFGAVIFLGNIIVTGAWMLLAERSREPSVLRFASLVVNWADVYFTGPGVILVLANGLSLASTFGGILSQSWITAGLTLFAASGVIWVGFLIRYQDKLIRLSEGSLQAGGHLPDEFFRLLHRWYFWGALATILPIGTLSVMVLKPALWG